MALNKYMHPRNIYKNPPDFAKLTKNFSEFASISKVDVAGKVTIDFKDPQSLRILTKCLLKSDFNLDVDIPEERLVPTLPLRLNYVLWIEDLMKAIGRFGSNRVRGLDIGTGACAIYPLLAAVKNKWQMVGTETDEESLHKAQENIQNNNLQDLIQLRKNDSASIFEHLFANENEQEFDFSMCNPPFYSNMQEVFESRSIARPPPKNAFTGSPHELITEGGELEFSRKMIKESRNYKDKVIIFTTMVGHKFNLKELLEDLKEEGVKYTSTEFCQGRVTRWGLAWTYNHNHDIYKLVPPREKLRKKNLSTTYQLPDLTESLIHVENAHNKIKEILQGLQITYKILNKRGNSMSLDIIATENTWSNQRRKRRLIMRQQSEEHKKFKPDNFVKEVPVNNNLEKKHVKPNVDTDHDKLNVNAEHDKPNIDPEYVGYSADTDLILKQNNANGNVASSSQEKHPLVHAFLQVFKKESHIFIETDFINGCSGKEGLHQIVQYIKNNWK